MYAEAVMRLSGVLLLIAGLCRAQSDDPAARLLKQDVETMPSVEGVMFVGGSTIAKWDQHHYFPQYRTINRGIAGSRISDATRYADRLIVPLKPSTIIFCSGEVDAAGGATADQLQADINAFIAKIHSTLPKTHIVLLAIPPSPAHITGWSAASAANEKLKDALAKEKQVHFLDIGELLTTPDGKPIADLFGDDHDLMSKDGYELVSQVVRLSIKNSEMLYWRGFTPPANQ